MTKVAFVCVGNANRSQIAAALAEAERERRSLDDELEIVTGGTDPKEEIPEEVIEVMREEGIDLADRAPREITPTDVVDADYIVTLGCEPSEFTPDDWDGTAERWDLPEPHGHDMDAVRSQRDEIKKRVGQHIDLLQA